MAHFDLYDVSRFFVEILEPRTDIRVLTVNIHFDNRVLIDSFINIWRFSRQKSSNDGDEIWDERVHEEKGLPPRRHSSFVVKRN